MSIPLDDWDKPALGPAVVRTVSHRVSPDTERLRSFADRINRAQRPMLVYGPEVDRSGAWDAGVAFAEKVGAPVYGSPLPDRVSFVHGHWSGDMMMDGVPGVRAAGEVRPLSLSGKSTQQRGGDRNVPGAGRRHQLRCGQGTHATHLRQPPHALVVRQCQGGIAELRSV